MSGDAPARGDRAVVSLLVRLPQPETFRIFTEEIDAWWDHPARHGRDAQAFIRSMGLRWGELMSALREHTAAERGGA